MLRKIKVVKSLSSRLMISILSAVVLITSCGENMNDRSETGNPKNSCYWSLGSYPGWIQSRYRPDELDYTPWTHLMHFAMYPTWDGRLGNGEISDSNADAAVEAAHEAGVPIILVVGGEGYGSQFTIATDEAHRAQFVSDIVDRISKHGYDGISVDWEEYVHGHEAQLIALVRELRIALDSIDDGLFLLIDVIDGLVKPSAVAEIADEVDSVNIMSYWDEGIDQVEAYVAAGVPASKIVLGVGLSYDYYDLTPEHVETKISITLDYKLRGLEIWAMHDLENFDDPRLQPLRSYVTEGNGQCS